MPLLIHASIEVSGDPAQLASFRELVDTMLAAEHADLICTERHLQAGLYYDLKTAQGIPFPVFIGASEAHPDLRLALEWVNPEAGRRGAASIQAGRIVEQSTDPLGQSGSSTLPFHVEASDDGSLRVALVLLAFCSDQRTGYAITAERDALFQLRQEAEGGGALLWLAEGDGPRWDSCWEIDLEGNEAVQVEAWTALPIDADQYAQWRALAEAFVGEWLWLEADTAEATALERERYAKYGLPARPANLRYQKLKSLREGVEGPVLSTLAEEDRRMVQVVLGRLET